MIVTELAERVRRLCPDVVVARGEASVLVDRDGLLEALQAFRVTFESRAARSAPVTRLIA